MARWMQGLAAGVMAAAWLAGPAAASTVLTQTLNLTLGAGTSAYAGQFDLSGLLHDADGRTFSVTGGRLAAAAYSSPDYAPATPVEIVPPATFPTIVINPDGTGFSFIDQTIHTRLVAHVDNVPDQAFLSAIGQFASAGATPHNATSEVIVTTVDSPGRRDVYNDLHTYTAIYGPLDVAFDLNPLALQLLNFQGLLDYNFSIFGQGRLDSVSLTFDRVQTGGPPPVSPGTAVPEPAAWTLMIAGFGLAGSALRRAHGKGRRFRDALAR